MDINYLPQHAITVKSYAEAARLSKILLENQYVVMIGREEKLWTINWLYSELSDRNDVVFINREDFEDYLYGQE